MELVLKIIMGITLLVILIGFLPVVEALPFGIDTAMTYVSQVIHTIITLFPFMEVIWTGMLLAMAVEMLFLLWSFINWILQVFIHG